MANRNPDVDEWFAEKHHPLEPIMQAVRTLVLEADERIEESIKWKTPTYSFNGNIFSFNPAKRFVSLMFHDGASIDGDFPRLDGDGRQVRVMRFHTLDDVSDGTDELRAVIRAWCEQRA